MRARSAPRLLVLIILGALTAFAPFTIDSYLPAFPAISADLGIDPSSVQITLAGTMLGFAVGQLVVGPLSDRIGRKTPLLLGCALHVAASVAVILSSDLLQLTLARIIQGFGAASGTVIALAVTRDLFSGLAMVRALSAVALVSGLAPLIAPVAGSQILRFGDWRVVFVFLAGYGVLMLVASRIVLPETLPKHVRNAFPHRTTFDRYRVLLTDVTFVGLMLLGGLRFTALFAYLQASPFLFQTRLGLDAQEFGIVFAVVTVGMLVGVQSSSRLVKWMPSHALLGVSMALIAGSGVLLFLSELLDWGVVAVIACCLLFMLGCGVGLPMIQTLALLEHPEEAGTAAALVGAASFGAAALLSPIIGLIGGTAIHESAQLAIVFVSTGGLGAATLLLMSRRRA